MIIDIHHHLGKEKGYVEKLADEARRLKIDKICLMSLPFYYGFSSTSDVYKTIKKYPDLFIGFAFFYLGKDKPDKIKKIKEKGFKGIKFIHPLKDYDDKSFYPVYEKIIKYDLIPLFHTGIVVRYDKHRKYNIDSDMMRPIYLDTIARAFPELNIIGAHLGNPWYEEGAMAARWNPNLYFDLTGSTLKRMEPKDIEKLLWWKKTSRYKDPLGRCALEKIVFGSDVPYNEIEDVYNDYKKLMDALNVESKVQKKVFGETARSLLKL